MATKQIVIDIAEINTIRLTCPKDDCGAVLEFPLPMKSDPTGCPACNQRFAGGTPAMGQFLEYMHQARGEGVKLAFIIPDIPSQG